MPKLSAWSWWVGTATSVEDDGTYDIDNCHTREEAIQSGMRNCRPGERFFIIEARLWERKTEPRNPDREEFARCRNGETFIAGPHLLPPLKCQFPDRLANPQSNGEA